MNFLLVLQIQERTSTIYAIATKGQLRCHFVCDFECNFQSPLYTIGDIRHYLTIYGQKLVRGAVDCHTTTPTLRHNSDYRLLQCVKKLAQYSRTQIKLHTRVSEWSYQLKESKITVDSERSERAKVENVTDFFALSEILLRKTYSHHGHTGLTATGISSRE